MEDVFDINEAINHLKNGIIVYSNCNYFVYKSEHVHIYSNSNHFVLSEDDFVDLYKGNTFYIKENDVEIDEEKDEDYYRYYRK